MKTFYFENMKAYGYNPHFPDLEKEGEVKEETIEAAARAAWTKAFPGEGEAPAVERRIGKVCCGPIRLDENQEQERLRRKFGHFWQSYTLKEPFEEGTRCRCCAEDAERRVEANVWGTVLQFDACAEHAEKYDGARTDRVPIFEPSRKKEEGGATD